MRERERERVNRFYHTYNNIISLENLLKSWQEFLRGKRKRKDVTKFSLHFIDHLLSLHRELSEKTYQHGSYHPFKKHDPKPRDIHKASVRDRLVHHAIYRILYPYFERHFICDSYSCRLKKGTHRAINRLLTAARKISRNNTRTAWILKCDIQKFFANIDHTILRSILAKHIKDTNILWLTGQIVNSFSTTKKICVGLPLGNLTSQLFINIYMNEFDQFVKRKLKLKHYIRFADDFIILHESKIHLEQIIPIISKFLNAQLKLTLHPNKVSIETLASGIDFLGWIQFPRHRLLRTSTKRRMLKRLQTNQSEKTLASYLGLLSHGNTHKLAQSIQEPKDQRFQISKMQSF